VGSLNKQLGLWLSAALLSPFLITVAPARTPLPGQALRSGNGPPGVARRWKTYRSRRLRFVVSYPSGLLLEKWPEGLTIVTEDEYPWLVFMLANHSVEARYSHTTSSAWWEFEVFSKAKPGVITEEMPGSGTYTKIGELTVGGFPAFKVSYEYRPSRKPLPENAGRGPSPSYRVTAYVKKGAELWTLTCYALDREMHEKRAETWGRILSSFKFL
jgi:hypothetical protein